MIGQQKSTTTTTDIEEAATALSNDMMVKTMQGNKEVRVLTLRPELFGDSWQMHYTDYTAAHTQSIGATSTVFVIYA